MAPGAVRVRESEVRAGGRPSRAVWTTVPLRLALAAIFLAHGAGKLLGDPSPAAAILAAHGIPFSPAAALVLGATEVTVGSLLLLGAYTRPAALVAGAIMVGALALVKLERGFVGGAEFDLLVLAASVAVYLGGPGPLALDSLDPPG